MSAQVVQWGLRPRRCSSSWAPALQQFQGAGAALSVASITRLRAQWQEEATAFGQRDLWGADYVYTPHPVALVHPGTRFHDGKLVESPNESAKE